MTGQGTVPTGAARGAPEGNDRQWWREGSPRPRWLRPSAWVAGLLVLTVAVIGGTWWWQRQAPQRVVDDFLQALADGDLERAADLGPQPLWKREDDKVRTVVIPPLEGPGITDWTIDEVERHTRWTTVRATIVSTSGEDPAEFTVEDGQLDTVDYPGVRFQAPTGAGAIMVNGERVGLSNLYGMTVDEMGIGTIYLTPGTHDLALPVNGDLVTSRPQTVTVPPELTPGTAQSVDLTYDLTADGEAEIERLVHELVTDCTSSNPPVADSCPISRSDLIFAGGAVPEGTWEVVTWPTLEIEPGTSDIGWRVRTVTPGEAVFTVAEDGPTAPEPQRQSVSFSHTAHVRVDTDGSLALD